MGTIEDYAYTPGWREATGLSICSPRSPPKSPPKSPPTSPQTSPPISPRNLRDMEMGIGPYAEHPAAKFDQRGTGLVGFLISEREISMDCHNDPRFCVKNVLEKRIAAFNKLAVISSIMLGAATGEIFKLKKDFDLNHLAFGWLPLGVLQLIGLMANLVVSFCCILAIFVLCQQSFYVYRLMSAGATGFEQASMFYLNRTIVFWRHLAARCLSVGMVLFVFGTGLLVFHDFYQDCKTANKPPMSVVVLNAPWQFPAAPPPPPLGVPESAVTATTAGPRPAKLSEVAHTILGGCFLVCSCCFAVVLRVAQYHHKACFQAHYNFAHTMSLPLMQQARGMGTRAGNLEHGPMCGARD